MRVMLTNPWQIDQVFEDVMGTDITSTLTPRQAQIQAQVDNWIAHGPKISASMAELDVRKVPKKCHPATGWRPQVDR